MFTVFCILQVLISVRVTGWWINQSYFHSTSNNYLTQRSRILTERYTHVKGIHRYLQKPAAYCHIQNTLPHQLDNIVMHFNLVHILIQYNSTNPDAGYPDRLGPSGKFVQNSTKLTCLEITGYQIKYSTVLWLIELQIRRGRKV